MLDKAAGHSSYHLKSWALILLQKLFLSSFRQVLVMPLWRCLQRHQSPCGLRWRSFPTATELGGTGPRLHHPPWAHMLFVTRPFEIKNRSCKAHKSGSLQIKADIIFSLLFSIFPSLSFFLFKYFATGSVLERGSKPSQCQGGSQLMEEQSMCLAVLLDLKSTLMIFGKSVETVFRNQFNFHLRSPLSLPENDVLKQDQLHLYSCQFSHES